MARVAARVFRHDPVCPPRVIGGRLCYRRVASALCHKRSCRLGTRNCLLVSPIAAASSKRPFEAAAEADKAGQLDSPAASKSIANGYSNTIDKNG
mgnify:CR=1 FL=1